jgi:DNA ligase 1
MLPARPLLAYTVKDLTTVKFPVLASPKIDGIRCLIGPMGPVSRSLKPIPNHHIRRMLNHPALRGLDGEIMLADPSKTFRDITSAVMSEDGEPDFMFWAFDNYAYGMDGVPTVYRGQRQNRVAFRYRFIFAQNQVAEFHGNFVDIVHHEVIQDLESLQAFEEAMVVAGHEGIMVRAQNGTYKPGRSTEKEGILGKVKRFSDAEAICIGIEELMRNENEAKTNALGLTERSRHLAGKVPGGIMGKLVLRTPEGIEFKVGTGFTTKMREEIWKNPPIGKLVKYKSMDFSDYSKPRSGVFLGIRDERDL